MLFILGTALLYLIFYPLSYIPKPKKCYFYEDAYGPLVWRIVPSISYIRIIPCFEKINRGVWLPSLNTRWCGSEFIVCHGKIGDYCNALGAGCSLGDEKIGEDQNK